MKKLVLMLAIWGSGLMHANLAIAMTPAPPPPHGDCDSYSWTGSNWTPIPKPGMEGRSCYISDEVTGICQGSICVTPTAPPLPPENGCIERPACMNQNPPCMPDLPPGTQLCPEDLTCNTRDDCADNKTCVNGSCVDPACPLMPVQCSVLTIMNHTCGYVADPSQDGNGCQDHSGYEGKCNNGVCEAAAMVEPAVKLSVSGNDVLFTWTKGINVDRMMMRISTQNLMDNQGILKDPDILVEDVSNVLMLGKNLAAGKYYWQLRMTGINQATSRIQGDFTVGNNPVVLGRMLGDADNDKKVTILDFAIWRHEFVSKTGLRADFDDSGGVTILDFARWRQAFVGAI